MKILVVDDEPICRNLISRTLSKSGYTLLEAADAQAALKLLEGAEPIGLVITDLMMPGMDGLDFIATVRRTAKLAGLPIVITTAMSTKYAVMKALELRAAGYLVKPLDIHKLRRTVDEIVSKSMALADPAPQQT